MSGIQFWVCPWLCDLGRVAPSSLDLSFHTSKVGAKLLPWLSVFQGALAFFSGDPAMTRCSESPYPSLSHGSCSVAFRIVGILYDHLNTRRHH